MMTPTRPDSPIIRLAALLLIAALAALGGCGGSSSGEGSDEPAATTEGEAAQEGREEAAPQGEEAGEELRWLYPPRPIAGVRQRAVGEGIRAAVVLWERGGAPPRETVLFLHGFLPKPPAAYEAWLRHLALAGNTIVYPVFQGPRTASSDFLANAVPGIAAGFRLARTDPGSLVAVGDTVGGALAFDYAAVAAERGLAVPRGVLAAFPGRDPPSGRVPPADLAKIPPWARLAVIAGPGDPIPDGEAQARALLAGATRVPESNRRYLRAPRRSGPTGDGPRSRRAFWAPLDRLIAEARGS